MPAAVGSEIPTLLSGEMGLCSTNSTAVSRSVVSTLPAPVVVVLGLFG
jgi:hypothetical protein